MTKQKSTGSKQVYMSILAVALLSFIGILTETATNVIYPELSRTFGISLDTTQWITAGYLLMVTITMGTTAYLLKRFPVRRIQFFAVVAFIVGDIASALAPSFVVLMLGRLIQAVATGLATPSMFHLIFTQIPRKKLGEMTGMAAMVISLAPALGPSYGGLIASRMNWQMIFWFILPLAVISLILGQLFIHTEATGVDGPFSYASFIVLAAAMFTWIDSLSMIGKHGFTLPFYGLLILSLILFGLFVWINIAGKSQLMDLTIFKRSAVSLDALTYFGLQFMNIGISLVIPVYAQYVLHSDSFIAGLILLPGTLLGAVISPMAGHMADRYGFRVPVMIGTLTLLVGALIFWLGQKFLTPGLLTIAFMVLRVGFNMAFPNTISNATVQVEAHNTADVSSIFNMVQQFAGATGVVFLASLMAIFQNRGTGTMTRRTYIGGRVDFIMMVIFALITFLICAYNYWQQSRQQEIKQ